MTTVTISDDTTTAPEMRALSVDEIDAVGGGSILIGAAVGAAIAYFGLHTAVETFLLDQQEKYYAAR